VITARSWTRPTWPVVLRATIALVVLLLAAVVALWPRGQAPRQPAMTGPPAPDLMTLRERAGLASCPAPPPGAAAVAGPLAGVSVPCLADGAAVPVGPSLAGRETLLNLWSHTCQPCRDELPALQDYAARPDAVAVLGVQVDGSPQAGLAMLTALGVRLPSVADPDGTLRAALAAPPVLPLSYLVSADGTVRMVNPPVVFHSADEVAATVRLYRAGA
jgi:hypothetical protein